MARQLRILYPGAWYHIACRGNEKARIFHSRRDREKLLRLLAASAEDFSVELHCYCLMRNHFHLLLKTMLANLDRFMQQFNTAYIVYFNKRHQRVGHLYQGRYKAILVDADNYLLHLSRYIHLNPVRTEREKSLPLDEKIRILESYEWSSYRAYVGKEDAHVLKIETILGMVGAKGVRSFRDYREFVLQGLVQEATNPLDEKKARAILGSDKFIERVYEEYARGKEEKEYSFLDEIVPVVTVEDIARETAKLFDLVPADLFRRYSRTEGARGILVELSCRHARKHFSLTEIASKLGITVSALLAKRKRFNDKMEHDRSLKRLLAKVERVILVNNK